MEKPIRKKDLANYKGRYRTLMNSLKVGFALITVDYVFLEVNDALLEMMGRNRDEVVGRHTRELWGTSAYHELYNIVEPLEAKHPKFFFEYFVNNVSGEKIPTIIYINNIVHDDGSMDSSYVFFVDIREQKKYQAELETANLALTDSHHSLEKEKKLLEGILFGIADCVTVFDAKGQLMLSNPKGIEIRGRRQEPLLPLKVGGQRELTLTVAGEKRQYLGQIEEICDHRGICYAYAEILKDITPKVQLAEREQEIFHLKRKLQRGQIETQIIGTSAAMQRVFDLILRCAEVDSNVLVLGESGVGKEMAARAIYAHSVRKDKPFVAVNCGALPETLLESELFGHVKGAFTGATSDRPGLFREAHGGTLFLDEIGDLQSSLQVSLLRALQEMEIRPVGGSRSYPVDVRLICATNKNLMELVNQEKFRHDLYYRIAVIPFQIPPLRDRKEDIFPLIEHFIRKHKTKGKQTAKRVDAASRKLLIEYAWPGNIRELENAIEYALAMARGPVLTPACFPVQIIEKRSAGRTQQPTLAPMLAEAKEEKIQLEKAAIKDAIQRHKGNQTAAAKELGISRTTLWRKKSMYNIES